MNPQPPTDVDIDRPLSLTPQQRQQFDEEGFFLVEDLLSGSEVEELLSLVVDVMGCNIQLRTSYADVRPPQPATDATTELGAPDSFFPWHSHGPRYGWPLVDGVVPFMEMKVGLYLTDLQGGHRGGDLRRARQSSATLADCTPIQRQLLGELGTGLTNHAGDDPEVHPISLYWRPEDDEIPLQTWAEQQRVSRYGQPPDNDA